MYIKWMKQFSSKWEISVTLTTLQGQRLHKFNDEDNTNPDRRVFTLTFCPEFTIIKITLPDTHQEERQQPAVQRIHQMGSKSPCSKRKTTQKKPVGKLSKQEENL